MSDNGTLRQESNSHLLFIFLLLITPALLAPFRLSSSGGARVWRAGYNGPLLLLHGQAPVVLYTLPVGMNGLDFTTACASELLCGAVAFGHGTTNGAGPRRGAFCIC